MYCKRKINSTLSFNISTMNHPKKSLIFILIYQIISIVHCHNINTSSGIIYNNLIKNEELVELNMKIMDKLIINHNLNCLCIICDEVYLNIFQGRWFNKIKRIPYIMIVVEESEDLLSPNFVTLESIRLARKEGCQMYVIFLANGLQAARLLKFSDKYRVLDLRAKFLMLHDYRLFDSSMHYIWRRIVNIIFIRHYVKRLETNKMKSWFELSTVPFPYPFRDVLITQRLETWKMNGFLKITSLYPDKTSNMKGYDLQVVAIDHVPAVAKLGYIEKYKPIFSGIEANIVQTISKEMNFKPIMYESENRKVEKWGQKYLNGSFSGLLGETIHGKADLALGNLHYIPYHLQLIDLSIPYTTQCLTFLTPEALTDNSWKTLILPFKLYMWVAVLVVLFLSGFLFYGLAKFHEKVIISIETNQVKEEKGSSSQSGSTLKNIKKPSGLYLFGELFNSILYTFGMLLVISLPKLPSAWSMRLLTGWYWLYCVLVVVSYRASMTAILANPTPRITIDTMEELANSEITTAGWGEQTREFFLSSLDEVGQKIGQRYKKINNANFGTDQVAKGKMAYFENVYYLKYLILKHQERNLKKNENQSDTDADDINNTSLNLEETRNLHIMKDCAIHMPISLGLQKNSPLKPRIDALTRKIIEAGLVKKWLNDAMIPVLSSMLPDEENIQALMTLQKFYFGFVALFTGYGISLLFLVGEILYWKYIIKKDPDFDIYNLDIYYMKKKKEKYKSLDLRTCMLIRSCKIKNK